MSTEYFRQCMVVKNEQLFIAWLPEVLAKCGTYLRFDDLGDGWKVAVRYNVRLPQEEIMDRSRDWTRTRKASDI